MSAYLAWSALTALAICVATWLVLRLWDRRVRREICEERRVLVGLEAEREALEGARRMAEAQRTLLLHEVNHRARNALTVVQALLRISGYGEPQQLAEMSARIAALGRAHDLLAEREWSGADLAALAERALSAFLGESVALQGPHLQVLAAAVQPLSMVLHELATNAAKYGALSGGGRVLLEWRMAGAEVLMRWSETGGPRVPANPERRGMGTRVIDTIVRSQLGGRLTRNWRESGLEVELAIPATRILAPPEGAPLRRLASVPDARQV